MLDDYKEREQFWPCVAIESAGETLELRNGSREFVREMERIACDPTSFIKEWREQPILMKVRKIVSLFTHLFLYIYNYLRTEN